MKFAVLALLVGSSTAVRLTHKEKNEQTKWLPEYAWEWDGVADGVYYAPECHECENEVCAD